jgi:hypothetical protein
MAAALLGSLPPARLPPVQQQRLARPETATAISLFIIGEGVTAASLIATIRWRGTASLNLKACSRLGERRCIALDVHQT